MQRNLEFSLEDMRRYLHVEILGTNDCRFFVTVIPGVPIPKDDPTLPWYAKIVGRLWEVKNEGHGGVFSGAAHPTKQGNYYVTDTPLLDGKLQIVPLKFFDQLPTEKSRSDEPTAVDWQKEKPRVVDALKAISPLIDWQTWRENVLMPLHDTSGGRDDCYRLLDEWACGCRKFGSNETRKENRRQWDNLNKRQDVQSEKRRLGSFYRFAFECGWKGGIEPVTLDLAIPQSAGTEAGSLAENTITAVRQTFSGFEPKHDPSPAQWLALTDLAAHLEAMAAGTAKPLYYLSSLDPGVGKTQTITHFIKALQSSPDHDDVGAIIFVGRLKEIGSFIKQMELDDQSFAVCVSDNDEEGRKLNAMGNLLPNKARLLFTTQQMLEEWTKSGRKFSELANFYYRGKPRAIRIWDETCLPARALTIDVEQIQELEKIASKADQQTLKDLLGALVVEIRKHVGETISLPNIYKETGLDDNTLNRIFRHKKELQNAIFDLALLSGKTARVVRDGKNRTIVDYANTLPDDLKPMIITDASGRVRQTYHYWSDGRGDLVKLREGGKGYSNLTLNIWQRAASKSAWKKDHKELIAGILSAIHSKPDDEKWLIIYPRLQDHFDFSRRDWTKIDIPEILRASVRKPERLTFVYWGGSEFRATNEHREIKNVILAGTHFLPTPAYQALARLSLGLASDKAVPSDVLRRIEHGEHANYILQAVCRSAVRQSIGGGCGSCDVYVIASLGSGIPSQLRDGSIFTNANVQEWQPMGIKPKGRAGDVLAYFEGLPENVTERRASVVADDVEMDYDNFKKRMVRDDRFIDGLSRMDWTFQPGSGGRPAVFRRATKAVRQELIELPV